MKKILVFGGTRFFGKKVVEHFIHEQYDVTIATRGQTTDDFGEHVQRVTLDRTNPEDPAWSFLHQQKWDVVFDNICFTWEEAKLALDNLSDVKHYLLTSSLAVYQGDPSENGFTEDEFIPSEYTFTPSIDVSYGEGKRQAETYFAKNAPFPVTYLRFPVVLDDDDYTERLHFYIRKALHEEEIVFRQKNGMFSFVQASEIPQMLSFLLSNQFEGAINLGSSHPFTTARFLSEISRVTSKKLNVVYDSQKKPSPFSNYDQPISVDKLARLGYPVSLLDAWLPSLMKRITLTEQ